jgi:hypothetical protein
MYAKEHKKIDYDEEMTQLHWIHMISLKTSPLLAIILTRKPGFALY